MWYLHPCFLVVYRTSGTGEIIDLIDLNVERKCHIMANQLKPGVSKQMVDVPLASGVEIVGTNDLVALLKQFFAEP